MSTKRYHPIFLKHNGLGPWSCYFCKKLVHGPIPNGKKTNAAIVHHIDEDHYNDTPSNLAIAHHGCHASHHANNPPNDKTQSDQAKRGWKKRKVESDGLANSYCTTTGERRSEASRKSWETRRRNQNA